MICKHQFEKVDGATKAQLGSQRGIPGVEVVCVMCGQTRKAFVDGSIMVTNDGQGPIDEDAGTEGRGGGIA